MREMPKRFDSVYTPVLEKDEHKKSKEYKKLSPKMRDAVDDIFAKISSTASLILGDNFLYSLDFLCSSFSVTGV